MEITKGKHTLTGDARWNFWLCVANGAIVSMGMGFFAFETVLAGLAFKLTGSALLVGLLTSASTIGWLWPQLFVGNLIEHVERKMPVYKASATIRTGALGAMVLSVVLFPDRPNLLYGLLLLLTLVLTSAGGICVIPFMDIVAKSIPPEHRSMLFAYRRFLGGILGFVAGLIVVYVLSPEAGLRYPHNYALLLLAGLGVCCMAYACFMSSREPIEPVAAERAPFLDFLRRGSGLFRQDRDFRLYFMYRVLFAFGTMGQVLIVPFVMEAFDAPLKSTGLFAAIVALVSGLSSLFWGRLSHRHGEAVLFRAGTVVLLLSPACALAVALLAEGSSETGWIGRHYLWMCLFMFGCQAAARNATDIAGAVYMLGLPTPEMRPTYMAFMNTLSAPLTLTPFVAGALASGVSYAAGFSVALLATLGAVVVGWRLRSQG